MNLHGIDIAIIISYFVILFGIGFAFARKKQSDEEYMLAGRRLTLPAFIMTLVTTWYGAILGIGEFVFGSGVVAWVTQGLFWYVVYLFFAFFLSKRVHDSGYTTLAEQLRARIGKKSGAFASIVTYIMSTPAPYVLSLGILVNVLFGISLLWSVLLGIGISALYIWFGGFRAVVRTDILQFVLMYVGFGLLLIMSAMHFGGFAFLKANLPAAHLTFSGGLGAQVIIVWGLLAFWTLVDPNFYQRCYAAQDGETARRGILWATVLWFIFDMLTLITGLYARAAFPESDALFSYLTLSDAVLPLAIKGLFVVTLLSIIMSTIDSFLFTSSSILSVDFFKKKYKQLSLSKLTRVGIIISLILSIALIAIFQSIIGIIYAIGSVGVATLLLPTLYGLFGTKKLSDTAVFVNMLLTAVAASVWMVHGWLHQEYGWPVYLYGIEPMYIGIGISAVLLFATHTSNKTSSV